MRSIEHSCSAARVFFSFFFFFFFFFFVSRSRRTHQKFDFCVVMISRTESQKIVVQNRGENITIELDKSAFRSFLGPSVGPQKTGQFCMGTVCFSMLEIIKMTSARKVNRSSLPRSINPIVGSYWILSDPILGSYRIRQSDRIPIGFLVTELYRNPSGRISSDCLLDPIVRSDRIRHRIDAPGFAQLILSMSADLRSWMNHRDN
jgi:hypothetical protein